MANKRVPSPDPYKQSPWGKGRKKGSRQAVVTVKGVGKHKGATIRGHGMPR